MKSLVSWICLIAATSANQYAFAESDLNAYRLGNYNKAIEPLLTKAGKDAAADYYLGQLFLYGYATFKNNDSAMRYFLQAAEKGHLPAIQLMARYNLIQQKNYEQATRWFKEAADKGDIDAQLFMAIAYQYGLGVKKNVDVATKYYIEAAREGNPLAQYALAENFLSSKHSANNKLGLIWLNKAAANNNPRALTKLGEFYLSGKGVKQDIPKGLELLQHAAQANFAPAMLQLGDYVLAQNEFNKAIEWYNKAAQQVNADAYLRLAHAYLQDKSPVYDVKAGFLWTLKAAENGQITAQKEVANMYLKGIGVAVNDQLAEKWLNQAAQAEKRKESPVAPVTLAARWLNNDTSDKIEDTIYQLKGIFSAWHNPEVLKNNAYNQAPKMELITAKQIFKPQFALTQPNDIPINNYYDALISKNAELPDNQWVFPTYPLNPFVQALDKANSFVIRKKDLPVPYLDADYYAQTEEPNSELMDLWMHGWQKKVNYMSVFNQMYLRALLGNPQSQFEIGQMFEYGIGVPANVQAATIFYQNAAEQQHLPSAYNLAILSLKNAQDAVLIKMH